MKTDLEYLKEERKKSRELKKDLKSSNERIVTLLERLSTHNRAWEYLTDVLERYNKKSWNFNENTLIEAMRVIDGILHDRW